MDGDSLDQDVNRPQETTVPEIDRAFPRTDTEVDERLFLKSVARAMDVLSVFAENPTPMSLGEIAAITGENKSSVQRIAQTFLVLGYLEKTEQGRLVPGRRILERSFDYMRCNPLIERATPVLTDLRKISGERVDLSLFDARHRIKRLEIIYGIRMQSKRETFYATLTGRRKPTFLTSGGRACMAHLPDAEIADILELSDLTPSTPKSRCKPEEIWEIIAEVRQDGYCFAAEETLIGELALAAAVCDKSGMPVGAVHIAGSLGDWSPSEFRKRFAPLAVEAARALSD